MDFLQSLFPALSGAVAGGLAAYVGIRADLAALKARMTLAETSLSHVHKRVDDTTKDMHAEGTHMHRRIDDLYQRK